ncbi:bromodomain-containing protein 7-like isoform X4 [Dermacentor albipictus]|uniref:bromodomain-containing protein 7-like isoform X4 n=1 Tax=Dermacentor albipictus TaxID=60249 RepID=UPI0031FE11E3
MGSKKHKKHHKSEKKEAKDEDRQEKSLKLVLKVGGSTGGLQTPVPSPSAVASPHSVPPAQQQHEPMAAAAAPAAFRVEAPGMVCHAHEGSSSSKHKKSKKKKKKKSSSKEHREKRHRHHHHHHHRHHHHHHKDSEKKEKRKCEHECSLGSEERPPAANAVEPPPAKRPRQELVPAAPEPSQPPSERPIRDPRTCTLKKSDKSPLQMLLYYLLKNLQKRDPQEFFAWPVNDIIAPGYSTIIHNPMDFSTMRKKIDDSEYACVSEFREDLKLMCDNAMTYNRPDTVYFKSAKRMWYSGNKLLSKDQLLALESSLPFFADLTSEELGFDVNGTAAAPDVKPPTDVADAPVPVEAAPLGSPEFAKKSKSGSSEEAASDDQAASEILLQAQKAARAAADRLTLKKVNSKFGFLRQMEDGSTTLSILNPDCGSTNGSKEMKVNLEMLVGKLAHGTGTLMDFKDDIKNIARPINYLNYGTYSTYAPHYDSTFANLSKEESDLVYSTYGDELGVQYAESLLSFAKDCDYVMDMVDNLLDVLTSGEHSKTVKLLEAHRNGIVPEEKDLVSFTNHTEDEEMEVESSEPKHSDFRPPDSFYALNDLTADSTVLDSNHTSQAPVQQNFTERDLMHGDPHEVHEHHDHHERHDHHEHHDRHDHLHHTVSESSSLDSADSDINAVLQQKLQESKEMIDTLSRLQQERLSATPPAHLSHIQGASELELELAEKIAKTLSELASHEMFSTPVCPPHGHGGHIFVKTDREEQKAHPYILHCLTHSGHQTLNEGGHKHYRVSWSLSESWKWTRWLLRTDLHCALTGDKTSIWGATHTRTTRQCSPISNALRSRCACNTLLLRFICFLFASGLSFCAFVCITQQCLSI